jgi:hypothetical protein
MQRFPLQAFMLASYWALQTLTSDRLERWYESGAYSFGLPSGDVWLIQGGQIFIGLSTILLFIELVRATRITTASLTNHALSVLVFVAALILFLTQPGYGNSIFFMFMLLTAFDFVAGFIITTAGARRDITVGRVERHA